MPRTNRAPTSALSPNEFHVLLVLAEEALYGYAIQKAVERESAGAVNPEIGSLYRILARLMSLGYVAEAAPPTAAEPDGRGRPRQYYALTPEGSRVLSAELERLRTALELARNRRLLTD